jgi:putative ABC transport system ATP-binding protein
MEENKTEKEAIIELKKINFVYNKGKHNAYQALYDIDLTIKRGSFVIIFGPSGCGKSSLLNMISLLRKPDDGEVLVDGNQATNTTKKQQVEFHRRKIGMIFQSYNLIPTLNVLDNVAIPQIFINKSAKERNKKAMELLDRFGIEKYAKRIPTELSGGEQQRIGIARTLINDQPIILADEPVGNLDSKSASNVMRILNKLNREEGKTIVMVSHNPENTIWGNHIVYMKDGKIEKEEFRDNKGGIKEVQKVNKNQDITGIEALLKNFQGLTKDQILMMIAPMKAKILTKSVLFDMEEHQLKKIEDGIRQRILKTINPKEFFEKLDKPEERGGAELNARTAKRISSSVEDIIKLAQIVAGVEDITEDQRIEAVFGYILKKVGASVKKEESAKVKEIISSRINHQIDRKEFSSLLDKPQEEGGAGLNSQTAKKIAKNVDMILMISYGVTGIKDK